MLFRLHFVFPSPRDLLRCRFGFRQGLESVHFSETPRSCSCYWTTKHSLNKKALKMHGNGRSETLKWKKAGGWENRAWNTGPTKDKAGLN